MGDIARNFWRWEFRCRDGCGFDTINMDVVRGAQELRDRLCRRFKRDVRLCPTSGCRCKAHNDRVKGVPNSQHLRGLAMDVWSPDCTMWEIAEEAEHVKVFREGAILRYPKRKRPFVHLDGRAQRVRKTYY